MAQAYNILEVFELAEQIERNGSAFYRLAADKASAEQVRDLLLSLGTMEDQHEILFGRLKSTVAEKSKLGYDPDDEALAYMQASASSHIFNTRDASALAREAQTGADVLRLALQVEKDTVALFTALRDAMPESWGRRDVEMIIEEEKRHVVMISTALSHWMD